MSDAGRLDDMLVFNSPGQELSPDFSSYLFVGDNRAVLMDPGPDSHVESYLDELESHINGEIPLYAVVLSPFAGCLSGLRLLNRLTRRRILIAHWTVCTAGDQEINRWEIRASHESGGTLPIFEGNRLVLRRPTAATLPGALVAYNDATRTLFSGPYFGSIGAGRMSGKPILRRESVRAYTDIVTPGTTANAVLGLFEGVAEIARIAPARGRVAVGGRRLVHALFDLDRLPYTVPRAFYRLFIRIGALLGEETAVGVYQATEVPIPDLERGYDDAEFSGGLEQLWPVLCDRMEQWISSSAMDAIRVTIVRLSVATGLDVPQSLQRLARQITRDEPSMSVPARTGDSASHSDHASDLPNGDHLEAGGKHGDAASFRGYIDDSLGSTPEDLSVMILAVDNIERINRRFGRSGGDDALNAVSYLLHNHRSGHADSSKHRLYKLDGPTFGYVVTGPESRLIAELAERIRKAISESAMFLEQLTVSIGAVRVSEMNWNEGRAGESPTERITRSAMSRLAAAQSGGMNTICAHEPEGAALLGGGTQVLIADPDAPYLHTLTRMLVDRGYSVLVAEDGQEVLDVISQFVPNAVVCEAMLPKLNGFAVREELRHSSQLSQIPFILISHRKNDEQIEKAALLGIVHYLHKPFSLVELLGLLDNLTGGQ